MEKNNNFDVAFYSTIQSDDFKEQFKHLQQSIKNDKDVLSKMYDGFKEQICENDSIEEIKNKLNELFTWYNGFEGFLNGRLQTQIQQGELYGVVKENEVDKIAIILAIARNKLATKHNFYSTANPFVEYQQTLMNNHTVNFWHSVKLDFFVSKKNDNHIKEKQEHILKELLKEYPDILSETEMKNIAEQSCKDVQPLKCAKKLICTQLIEKYNEILSDKVDKITNEQIKDPIKIKNRILEAIQEQESEITKQPLFSDEDKEFLKNTTQKEQFLVQKFKKYREQVQLPYTEPDEDDAEKRYQREFIYDYYNFDPSYYNFAPSQYRKVKRCATILEDKNENINISELIKYSKGMLDKDEIIDIVKNSNNIVEDTKVKIDKIIKLRKELRAIEPTNFWSTVRDGYKTRNKLNKINKKHNIDHPNVKRNNNKTLNDCLSITSLQKVNKQKYKQI